jgi:hypothetical protein
LNVLVHGELQQDGTSVVQGRVGEYLSPQQLADLIGDVSKYDCIRLLSCYSADGGERSFASKFANITGKRVKAYKSPLCIKDGDRIPEFMALAADAATLQHYYSSKKMVLVKSRPWMRNLLACNPLADWTYKPEYFEPVTANPEHEHHAGIDEAQSSPAAKATYLSSAAAQLARDTTAPSEVERERKHNGAGAFAARATTSREEPPIG